MCSKFTAGEVIEAIKEARGFVTVAASKLGCSRTSMYVYLKQYATAAKALEDEREKRHDYVESKLMAAIKLMNITAIIFYLKTQCKSRGYVERYQTELTGKDGGPIKTEAVGIDQAERDRSITALANTIANHLHRGGDSGDGAVDSAE